MAVVVVGVSHHTAPVDVRDRISILSSSYPTALVELSKLPAIKEAALISTCNRTEAYVVSEDIDSAIQAVVTSVESRPQ